VANICWEIIIEWESAQTSVWSSDVPFVPELFDQYCDRYSRCTRTFLTKAKVPTGSFEPTLCDMYEARFSGGSRIQAISYHLSSISYTIKCCSVQLCIFS
jgi:hypothetical protein